MFIEGKREEKKRDKWSDEKESQVWGLGEPPQSLVKRYRKVWSLYSNWVFDLTSQPRAFLLLFSDKTVCGQTTPCVRCRHDCCVGLSEWDDQESLCNSQGNIWEGGRSEGSPWTKWKQKSCGNVLSCWETGGWGIKGFVGEFSACIQSKVKLCT